MNYNLDDLVNHRIAMLAILLKRQILRIIAKNELDITPEQWIILYHLWNKDGLTISEVANISRKDIANATRIIDKLEKMGYVSKKRNENDSRSYLINALPKAEEIKNKVQNCWKESVELATEGISKSEQQELLIIIEKIESNVLKYLE
jgi:DNA-binding MarR family transcriptional regulator